MTPFLTSGAFLASAPSLLDPNFMHSVVLMLQHDSQGAVGLVFNREGEVTSCDLLPQHSAFGVIPFPVHIGGPVGSDTLQFVHTVPKKVPGGLHLGGGLFLGGGFDGLGDYIESVPLEEAQTKVRLILGYAGWAEGQLETELQTGSWLPAAQKPSIVFEKDQLTSWRKVVRSIGPLAEGQENLPPDVSWN